MALSELGAKRSLPWNLILWTTFSHKVTSFSSGYYVFSLEGDVKTIFNKPIIYASAGHRSAGLCESSSTRGYYDSSTNSLVYHVKDYFSNDITGKCPDTFNMEYFGISNSSRASKFKDLELSFDMQSAAIALAVNMDQLDISELSRVSIIGDDVNFPYDYCNTAKYWVGNVPTCSGLEVVDWAAFYAERYVGMDPLNCVGLTDKSFNDTSRQTRYFCFMRKGQVILFPVINHYERCECSQVNSDPVLAEKCNKQDILIGLNYFSFESFNHFPRTIESAAAAQKRAFVTNSSDDFLNKICYKSTLMTIKGVTENITTNQITATYSTLCPHYDCSLIVFNVYDQYSNSINGYALQVTIFTICILDVLYFYKYFILLFCNVSNQLTRYLCIIAVLRSL